MVTIAPRTAVVPIYGGDWLQRINMKAAEAEAAEKRETAQRIEAERAEGMPRRFGERPEPTAESEALRLAAEHDALVREAAEAPETLRVVIKALGRKAWKALVAQHPPREGNKEDEAVGVNEDTFKEPLVAASIVSPDLSPDDLDQLADVDFDRLYFSAFALNRLSGGDPKAGLVSRMSQRSSETSS